MIIESILIIAVVLLIIVSFAGCVLPVLPGPSFAFAALLLLKFSEAGSGISWTWICVFAVLTLAVVLLDFIIPALGAKKFGGTSAGIWGAAVGIIAGLFFFPLGIILFPFFGAFIGELISGKSYKKSFKAAFGTFAGFLFGTGLKLILCAWISVYAAAVTFNIF
jgi:Uncharacterized protein conserved in bacteria